MTPGTYIWDTEMMHEGRARIAGHMNDQLAGLLERMVMANRPARPHTKYKAPRFDRR